MLKVCWDCLFGNSTQNEDVHGTRQNSQALGNMAHRENKMIFRLPRTLNYEDELMVQGELSSNPEKISIALTSGGYSIDYNNIVCEIDARFTNEDNIRIRTVVNGEEEVNIINGDQASKLFKAEQFTVKFTLRDFSHISDEALLLNIQVNESHLTEIYMKHRIEDIAYLAMNHDISRVNELNFKFNNNY